jgi:hypothetical protein
MRGVIPKLVAQSVVRGYSTGETQSRNDKIRGKETRAGEDALYDDRKILNLNVMMLTPHEERTGRHLHRGL